MLLNMIYELMKVTFFAISFRVTATSRNPGGQRQSRLVPVPGLCHDMDSQDHCEAACDLTPLSKSATTSDADEVLVVDDLVNRYILSNIIRNVSLIFLTVALIFLPSVRLLFLIFLSSTRRPLSM